MAESKYDSQTRLLAWASLCFSVHMPSFKQRCFVDSVRSGKQKPGLSFSGSRSASAVEQSVDESQPA
jgi:hypothetical protein